MKTFLVFAAIVALLLGVLLVVAGPEDNAIALHGAYVVMGILLIAGGVTYLWKLAGFRGLKPR
jgi:hypothetical protein